MQNKKLWFRAKKFGWGWYPVSIEGWLITVLYVIAILQYAINADKTAHSASDALISISIPFIVTTVFLLIICYARGEKPKWNWRLK